MGIFGALTTAVAGLNAQSFALENISGNISNSQTTAYKRVDTSFEDIVLSVGQQVSNQGAGSVLAMSRATNSIAGPISSASVGTYMAINGLGYFQVQSKVGESDGATVFSGANVYTRRGDFTMNKEGYLVNGAGYYLMGIPIDTTTGNAVGDVAQVLKLSTGLLAAKATTSVEYNVNLPANPTGGLLDPSKYKTNPLIAGSPAGAATAPLLTGSAAYKDIDLSANTDNEFSFKINGTTITLTQADSGGDNKIDINEAVTAINAQLSAAGSTVTASAVGGKIQFTDSVTGSAATITVGSASTAGTGNLAKATDLGFGTGSSSATGKDAYAAGAGKVVGDDLKVFKSQSVEGGSTTVYDAQGNAVNVQLRWAKTATSPDTWNLYYQNNADATGGETAWTNVGTDFKFDSAGKLTNPAASSITIPQLTVGGVNVGDVKLDYGSGGLTQFASQQGTASVTKLTQDGYASGSLTSVAVGANGRITATYTNGQQIDVAKVPTYKFNGDSALKRLDGGAFSITRESGGAIQMSQASITGSALEGSNTDIAEEFSKMIVTQQAYSANSKVITTANDMMQSVLNILR